MILAITGHRDLSHPEAALRQAIRDTYEEAKPEAVIIGMASGMDLIAGDVAREMGIPYGCAVPWRGHTPRKADENLYYALINYAYKVVYVSEEDDFPGAWIYQKRNVFMIDHATHILAYYDGRDSGGTKNAIWYANLPKVQKPVRNIFDRIPPF